LNWILALGFFLGLFIILLLLGLPVAFAFLVTNLVSLYLFIGGFQSLYVVIPSAFDILLSYTMLSVPLFILMGEVIFYSQIGETVIDALDKWIGRIPSRLSLLSMGAGTIFAMLSGSSIATVVMLGAVLIPEMQRRGYSKFMSLGPILAGGSLAVIIPPTFLAVILGTLARVSIAGLLLGLVIPGLVLSAVYAFFFIIWSVLNPKEAPSYQISNISFRDRISSLRYILPLGIIIFLVIGTIFFGIATPEEAAALGALGSFGLAVCYNRLNMEVIKKVLTETAALTCMVFMIVIGSTAFSQLIAFTGAGREILEIAMGLKLNPILMVIIIQTVIFFLGFFIDQVSIMMITIPLVMPCISQMGFDSIWFCVLTMINLSIAGLTPPFGLWLFALKGAVPPSISFEDIVRAAIPCILIGIMGLIILFIFPNITLWLPRLVGKM